MSIFRILLLALVTCTGLFPSAARAAEAQDGPGIEAIDAFRAGNGRRAVVQNRFFLKENRFELTPHFGYVTNNPFARRYVVSLGFGYHFSESLAVHGQFSYSPDLGLSDLKGLTGSLLQLASQAGGNANFQQPLDKITLAFSAGVTWSPIYGKINLLGETVVNFDFYGYLGVAMLSTAKYNATLDGDAIVLERVRAFSAKVGPVIGLGGNFFITQAIALKLDTRFALYVDDKPVYDPDDPPEGKRVVNRFTVGGGLSFFFPKMKPRLFNF